MRRRLYGWFLDVLTACTVRVHPAQRVWMPYLDHPGGWWQDVPAYTEDRLVPRLLGLILVLAVALGWWLF